MKQKSELFSILNNKTDGSEKLLSDLNSHFLKNCDNIKYIIESLEQVKNEIGHFAVINDYVKKAEKILKKGKPESLKEFLRNVNISKEDSYNKIFIGLKSRIRKNIKAVTISKSVTLLKIFENMEVNGFSLEVYICESRPLMEGRNLAKELLKIGIPVTILTEAQAPDYLERSDLVLLGADQILKDGSIVNKTGSRMLAIIAKHLKKPVYVAATKNKFVNKNNVILPENDSGEIWKHKNKLLKTKNNPFEIVEKDLITEIITD